MFLEPTYLVSNSITTYKPLPLFIFFFTIKNKIIVCLHQLYAMYLTANLHFILTLYFK